MYLGAAMVTTRGSAAPRSNRDNGMHKFQQVWTDGADSASDRISPYWVTECAPLDENQNISYFTENLDYMDKIMFSTIMLTFITTQNGIQRYLYVFWVSMN